MVCVADNDELPPDFDQMKTSMSDFMFKRGATDFSFHIAHRTTDYTAFANGFGFKHGIAPFGIWHRGRKHLHMHSVANTG